MRESELPAALRDVELVDSTAWLDAALVEASKKDRAPLLPR
ncbi:hypothetical protein FDG2_2024 [Candidatus Protofrankia californiensis]|uniref:Uncharacterized protein n=1 Tax=Candidatus Protofrankia californiensis TaxID=1839754 RepID=A0A1C3NWS5_9ACTN|nr:hypothetical protein FDG2_2024 [Candidatus Protofrankia californiensis]